MTEGQWSWDLKHPQAMKSLRGLKGWCLRQGYGSLARCQGLGSHYQRHGAALLVPSHLTSYHTPVRVAGLGYHSSDCWLREVRDLADTSLGVNAKLGTVGQIRVTIPCRPKPE